MTAQLFNGLALDQKGHFLQQILPGGLRPGQAGSIEISGIEIHYRCVLNTSMLVIAEAHEVKSPKLQNALQ